MAYDESEEMQTKLCKYCNEPQASAVASQNTGRTGKTWDSWGLVLISLSTSLFSPPAQVFSQSPLISAKKKLCYPNNTMGRALRTTSNGIESHRHTI